MPRSRWRGVLGAVGSIGGSAVAAVAAGCCGGLPAMGALAGALGVSVLSNTNVSLPVISGAAIVASLGLWTSHRRHGSPWPVVAGLAGVVAVLVPFTTPLDVVVFRLLLYGGIALLLGSSVLNLWKLGPRLNRSVALRADRYEPRPSAAFRSGSS